MEEIFNFNQMDLVTEDVMLLDAGETLFVWIGLEANKAEREAVLVTAKDYLLSDPSGRTNDLPICVIKQGFEPPHFTGLFGAWDEDLFPAQELEHGSMMPSLTNGVTELNVNNITDSIGYKYNKVYSLEVLKGKEIPQDVDPAKKEAYLSEAQFQEVFGMDKEAFEAMPGWKKETLKKKVGLF